MASTIILSDNGASSGSAGLKSTAGNDGVLILQSTTSGGTATNALYIDNSQNVGLGVTPSAWSTYKSIQLPDIGFYGSQGPYVQMIANAYYNGTNYTRITANQASMYAQAVGQHQWHTAGSSTAGSTFTFTQAMTLDTSGNLGVGTTSPSSYGQLTSYTATGGKASLACISTYTAGTGAAATITAGDNSGSHSGGYGLKIFDKTDNGGGAQEGYGLYVAAPYDGSHSSGNNYALQKFGVYVDDLYGYYGVNSTYTWGVYAKGGAGNYFASTVLVGTTSSTAKVVFKCSTGGFAGGVQWIKSDEDRRWEFVVGGDDKFYLGYAAATTPSAVGNFATNGTYTATSDVRKKKDINYEFDGLALVNALKPAMGRMLDDDDSHPLRPFLIAQDTQPVLPSLVSSLEPDQSVENPILGVDYASMVPVLLKAIQEQQAIITSLTARIEALEGTQ